MQASQQQCKMCLCVCVMTCTVGANLRVRIFTGHAVFKSNATPKCTTPLRTQQNCSSQVHCRTFSTTTPKNTHKSNIALKHARPRLSLISSKSSSAALVLFISVHLRNRVRLSFLYLSSLFLLFLIAAHGRLQPGGDCVRQLEILAELQFQLLL